MADNYTTLLPVVSTVDELLGNKDGQTVRVPRGNITNGASPADVVAVANRATALEANVPSGSLLMQRGANIASASTVNLAAATGDFVDITGTTAITALGAMAVGIERVLRFVGVLTLTHNATSLMLPTGANILTEAGDIAVFRSLGSGNWRCASYQRASGEPLAGGTKSINDRVSPIELILRVLRAAYGEDGFKIGDEPDPVTGISNTIFELTSQGLSALIAYNSVNHNSFTDAVAADVLAARWMATFMQVASDTGLVIGDAPDPVTGISNYVFKIDGVTGEVLCTLGAGSVTRNSFDASSAGDFIREKIAASGVKLPKVKTISAKSQIVMVDGEGTETQISDGTANDTAPQLFGSSIGFFSDRSDGTEAVKDRAYRMGLDGKNLMRSGPETVYIFVMRGQSLGRGTGVGMITTAPKQLGATLMFNGGVNMGTVMTGTTSVDVTLAINPNDIDRLVPAYASTNENLQIGMALRLYKDTGIRSIVVNGAIPGAFYSQIAKGNQCYTNALLGVQKAAAIILAMGAKPVVVEMWQHGEADSADTKATYLNKINVEYANFSTDVKAITGQSTMHMFLAPSPSANASQVPIAMWQASLDNAYIHNVGPLLLNNFSDTAHFTATGYLVAGESIYYRAIRKVLGDAATWTPLQPDAANVTRSSAVITIPFQGNTGSLVYLADSDCPARTNWGIEYTDGSGSPPAISSLSISGNNLLVTLASTPSGSNKLVRGTYTAPGALPTIANIARTNLADQDPLVSGYDARAVPKRCVPFEVSVP